MSMTGEQLLAAVKRRCFWPAGVDRAPLSDADILALANEELSGELIETVQKISPTYYMAVQDYEISGDRYRLPDRARGTIQDVVWVDQNGLEWSIESIETEDVARRGFFSTPREARMCRHYLQGDLLIFIPPPSEGNGTLRVKYQLAPSTIVQSDDPLVAPIVDVNYNDTSAGSTIILVDAGQLTFAVDDLLDVVSAGNSHGASVVSATVTALLLSNPLAPAWTTPVDPCVRIGDYACTPGYTPLVPLPDAMLLGFVRHVAAACLDVAGDREAGALERDAAERLDRKAVSLLKPRNRAEAPSIVARNSPLRQGVSWKGYWPSRS